MLATVLDCIVGNFHQLNLGICKYLRGHSRVLSLQNPSGSTARNAGNGEHVMRYAATKASELYYRPRSYGGYFDVLFSESGAT